MNFKKYVYISLFASSILGAGCKKSYLDTVPSSSGTDANLYTTPTGCRTVLDGMARIATTQNAAESLDGLTRYDADFGIKSVDLGSDVMSADVCIGNTYGWWQSYYNWQGPKTTGSFESTNCWYLCYKLVNAANSLLNNIYKCQGDPNEIAEIKGEAYAWRAWCYYKLSEFYCQPLMKVDGTSNGSAKGIPIYVTQTTSATTGNPRGTLNDTYARIKTDIDSAVVLIENSGISTPYNGNKSYLSKATVYGIYAEIALEMHDWTNAAKYADEAITTVGGAGQLMDSTTYATSGFRSNTNSEFMWASALNQTQYTSNSIISFISFADSKHAGTYASVGEYKAMSATLYKLMPASDVRKVNFVLQTAPGGGGNFYIQQKFLLNNSATTDWTFDNVYMRLSEMYLIKAEALANSGDAANATTTLETLVKTRNPGYTFASTPYFTGTPQNGASMLLEEIYLQRRLELWLEGKSFTDLKRLHRPLNRPTGQGNFNATTAKVLTVPADDPTFLFKISQKEMDNNRSFTAADQNP